MPNANTPPILSEVILSKLVSCNNNSNTNQPMKTTWAWIEILSKLQEELKTSVQNKPCWEHGVYSSICLPFPPCLWNCTGQFSPFDLRTLHNLSLFPWAPQVKRWLKSGEQVYQTNIYNAERKKNIILITAFILQNVALWTHTLYFLSLAMLQVTETSHHTGSNILSILRCSIYTIQRRQKDNAPANSRNIKGVFHC